jgi:hypothetical protein
MAPADVSNFWGSASGVRPALTSSTIPRRNSDEYGACVLGMWAPSSSEDKTPRDRGNSTLRLALPVAEAGDALDEARGDAGQPVVGPDDNPLLYRRRPLAVPRHRLAVDAAEQRGAGPRRGDGLAVLVGLADDARRAAASLDSAAAPSSPPGTNTASNRTEPTVRRL